MKIRWVLALIASLIFALGLITPITKADDWNQATKFTFSQPVQIPGRILPAGTYWFELTEGNEGVLFNKILIFDADRMHEIASVTCMSVTRPMSSDMTGETVLTLTEAWGNHPAALISWFYPHTSQGNKFYYSPAEQRSIAEQESESASSGPVILIASGQ